MEEGARKKGEHLSPDCLSLDSGLAFNPNLRLTFPTCRPYSCVRVCAHLFLSGTHYVFVASLNVLANLIFAVKLIFAAHSEKAHHPEGVVLKVEADARPIKNPENGKKKSLSSVSRNQTRSVTPSSTSRTLDNWLTRKTASLMSRSRQDRRPETSSSQSFHHSKRAPQKRTSVRSRSPRNDQMLVTQSVTRFSLVTLKVTHSYTQSVTKASQGAQLYSSPPHLASRPEKTVIDRRNKSALFSKTSIKMESSAKGYARGLESKHSTEVQMASILYLKPSPTVSYWSARSALSKTIRNKTSHFEKTAAILNDSSLCRESAIFHDVSPPNGTAVALGAVPDMRTCIRLSCDASGDVAYLRSSQCFVITCDRPERCDPGKPDIDGISSTKTEVAILRKRSQLKKGKRIIIRACSICCLNCFVFFARKLLFV